MQHTQHKGLERRVSNDMDLAGRAMNLAGRAMLGPLTFFVIITALVLTIASCGGREKEGAVVSDEKKIEQIKSISMSQPELALSMLDSAEVLRTMPMYDVNALRAIVYNNSSNDNTKALHYALLASTDSMLTHNNEKRLAVASVLAYQYFKCGIYDRCLLTAEQAITLAQKLKAADKEASILNTKAMCESEIGLVDKALRSFDSGISLLRRQVHTADTWSTWSDLVDMYSQKANVLLDNHRYTEVAAMYGTFSEAVTTMTEHKPESVAGGNDWSKAMFYAVYSVTYAHLGEKQKAYEFYSKLLDTDLSKTPAGITFLVPYLLLERRYGEAITKLEEEEAFFKRRERDTVDYYFVRTLLPSKADALFNEGRYREAALTGLRAIALNDSLSLKLKKQNAMSMSQLLDSKHKDMRINEQARDLRNSRAIVALVSFLMAVLAVLFIRVMSYNRLVQRKNRAAAATINELTAAKEQLAYLLASKSRNDDAAGERGHDDAAEEKGRDDAGTQEQGVSQESSATNEKSSTQATACHDENNKKVETECAGIGEETESGEEAGNRKGVVNGEKAENLQKTKNGENKKDGENIENGERAENGEGTENGERAENGERTENGEETKNGEDVEKKELSVATSEGASEEEDAAARLKDDKSRDMFLQLEQRIINERLFRKPKISRDELIALLGVDKGTFVSLLMVFSGKPFNRYINDMRLDYAAALLRKNTNFSVEAIAIDCGIPVRQTFYRLFTEKFGLSPAEYRKMNE
ncbi:MAG: helix-turn-helix domain-containing protein [Prevotella sp.]|nr:helix-turn-helix domain-containing protein [Prevotella sp.]